MSMSCEFFEERGLEAVVVRNLRGAVRVREEQERAPPPQHALANRRALALVSGRQRQRRRQGEGQWRQQQSQAAAPCMRFPQPPCWQAESRSACSLDQIQHAAHGRPRRRPARDCIYLLVKSEPLTKNDTSMSNP